MKKKRCVLCKRTYSGFGNNALPLKAGQCCDDCNVTKVVPKRAKDVFASWLKP